MKNGNCCASVFRSKIMTIIIFLLAAMSVAVVIVAGYITTGTHAFTTFAKLPPRVSVLASSSLSYARQSTILYSQSSIPIPSTPTPNDNLSKKQMKQRYDDELEDMFAQQTKKRNPLLGIKSIGVDYGLVRTGLAVSIGYNPEGLDMIITDHPLLREDELEGMTKEKAEKEEERRLEVQRAQVAKKVVQLAKAEDADRIVVGLPLYQNGTEAPQTVLTRKFACNHLAIATLRTLGPGVTVYLCDERYTSKEAAARMRSRGSHSQVDLHGLLDAESAKIILEQYYNDFNSRYDSRDHDGLVESIDDPGYNGEIVTIQDVDLIEELTNEYNEKRRLEEQQLVAERNDRESRTKWRKLAMEQDRIRDEEQQEEENNTSKKSKKKKKKRKRR